MIKTLFFISITMLLLSIVLVVSGESTVSEDKEWQTIGTWSGTLYNASAKSDPDIEEQDERKIEPAPQPVLDLPMTKFFYITTISISLIVLFIIVKEDLLLYSFNSERLETPSD